MALHAERRTKAGWQLINLEQVHRDPWRQALDVPAFHDFNDFWLLYVLSARLLRGDPDDLPPPVVVTPRGPPAGLSRELEQIAQRHDSHYIHWLTAREVLEYDWDAYARFESPIDRYSPPRPNELLESIAKLEPLDEHRVIVEIW